MSSNHQTPALEASTDDIWMTTKEVAKYLKVSCSFLEKMRWRREGIVYHKPMGGKVLYRKIDVDRWMASQRCEPNAGPRCEPKGGRND